MAAYPCEDILLSEMPESVWGNDVANSKAAVQVCFPGGRQTPNEPLDSAMTNRRSAQRFF